AFTLKQASRYFRSVVSKITLAQRWWLQIQKDYRLDFYNKVLARYFSEEEIIQVFKRAKNPEYIVAYAASNGHLEVVKYLVGLGADIHANNEYALRWAAENGHLEMVKYLVGLGADIHVDNEQALRGAAESGHLEVV